ncbi:MAG: isocitrate lyase/phosphoenolpyruvate mutase family protein [Thermomonas sp.]|uniref:isocitrate lyase/PEP mutase family protein n=1 Tax=Thermomonas sp. TaxID=1971895 RepID=UPI0026313FDB|nr:isocitrate lyase/phosphoenolpyruvate mutase family protein [Thermomonas sp.]MCC7097162.1 isocitrate lyase/phosphoenolpyruvate mutase family protein [Thermomonas sp.]
MQAAGGPAGEALAQRFRELHQTGQPLLLPNAWDAGSAGLFASLGFKAIATTSGGVAWSLGYPDGECLPLAELLVVVRRIVRVVDVPVTVDFEAGFGVTPVLVGENVRALLDTGAVGMNLEDGIAHTSLRPLDEAAARIDAARKAADAAGIPAFINARVDNWIVGGADAEALFDDAVRRARAYLDAGADGIYPIALADPDTIRRFCDALPAPVNIGARAGLPDLAALGRMGVARVSTATRLAMVALAAAREAAQSVRDSGRFDGLDARMSYDALQQLFPPS